MRAFNYKNVYPSILDIDIVSLITSIHEYKGKQSIYEEAEPEAMVRLIELAKIQSTEASNKIEGISTTDERLKKIVVDKTMPKTRNEQEIAGYRDVLSTIHENYSYIPLKPSMILQLHRDLYKFSSKSIGGQFKASDNIIEETDIYGNKSIRFRPVHAWETKDYAENLCDVFDEVSKDGRYDPLILIPMFILDFLCIHPFEDGNGRMSRLLTLLLLYRSGYMVGKYVSIEKLIEKTKGEYYEALQQSSQGWHEGKDDYKPFVKYTLSVIVAAYRELDQRIDIFTNEKYNKSNTVRDYIKNSYGKVTKTEIMQNCPDISQVTVQRALSELLKSNNIIKIGGGRYTSYAWNREK